MLSFISKNLAFPSVGLISRRGNETAWEVMDRLMQDLDACERANEQISMTLKAVRDGMNANVVFWFDARENKLQAAADAPLSDAWGKAVMAEVSTQSQQTDSLAPRNFNLAPAAGVKPWPFSLALVALNRSRRIWLGAGRFQPGQPFRTPDLGMLSRARRMLHNQRRQLVTQGKLKDTLLGFVRCMTATIDAKDHTTGGHSERVARMAVRLGKQMQVPEPMLGDIYLAGILHDIGKIGIQDSILQKPGKLTTEEFDHLKQHAIIGDRIIANLEAISSPAAGRAQSPRTLGWRRLPRRPTRHRNAPVGPPSCCRGCLRRHAFPKAVSGGHARHQNGGDTVAGSRQSVGCQHRGTVHELPRRHVFDLLRRGRGDDYQRRRACRSRFR